MLIREKLREVRLLYGTNKRVRTPKYVKTLTIATSADWHFPAKGAMSSAEDISVDEALEKNS